MLEGHIAPVAHVCAVRVGEQELLASAGSGDGTVRVWDPITGEALHVLEGQEEYTAAVCEVRLEKRHLLVSVGNDRDGGSVKMWDLATGEVVRTI